MNDYAVSQAQVPDELREQVLAQHVAQHIRDGYRVESQTSRQAVVVKGRRPNHVLHLILTILTVGTWGLLVWLPLCVFGGEKRRVLTVNEDGGVDKRRGRG